MPSDQIPPSPPEKQLEEQSKLSAERFSRYFLLSLLLGAGIVFFIMIKIFIIPIILAAVFVTIFYPFYEWLLRALRFRKSLSAFFCCLILLFCLLIPFFILANLVANEAIDFYQTAEQKIQAVILKGEDEFLKRLNKYPGIKKLPLHKIDWQASLQEIAQTSAKLLAKVINKASKSTFQVLVNLFLTFFAMYYFFRDGDKFIQRLSYLSPLAEKYKEALFVRFVSISRATIKGTLLVGLIKGFLGGLTFWLFGIGSPVLWGVVMAVLSVIPFLGAWLVMYPAALIMVIIGHIGTGIALFLICTVIISSIDNILQPRLVARGSGMHDLLIFFSTLGGISMFGAMGFIVGPIITAFFFSILEAYSIEFKTQLVQTGSREK